MTPAVATLSPLSAAMLGLAAGLGLGLLHFATLSWVVGLLLTGSATGRAVALQLARFAILFVALAALARAGAMPLLAGALGVAAGRAIFLRRELGRA